MYSPQTHIVLIRDVSGVNSIRAVTANTDAAPSMTDWSSSLLCCLLSVRVVRLDWSHPGRPSGIMLGYEVLRWTLRSCSPGSALITSSSGEDSGGGLMLRCSYLECPAAHGVCGMSCFHADAQVILFWSFHTHVCFSVVFSSFSPDCEGIFY